MNANPPPVLNKADFVRRYRAGEFGNASQTWDTTDEFFDWGYGYNSTRSRADRFHLRNRVAGGETHYNLTYATAIIKWLYQRDPSQWYVSMMAPHEHNLIQGEVEQADINLGRHGLDLTYTMAPGPMRDALKAQCKHAYGIIASQLLRAHMDDESWEWLNILLERYPGHVVEFSTFGVRWGTLMLNSVFWEVRQY